MPRRCVLGRVLRAERHSQAAHWDRCPEHGEGAHKRVSLRRGKDRILTEERLQLVKPQSGKTGLDHRFDKRNLPAVRVGLQGPLTDELPHSYDLDDKQVIVTAPSRLTFWRASMEKQHYYTRVPGGPG